MFYLRGGFLLLLALLLSACASGPSHLPGIADIPGVIGGGISEAAYKKRRARVKAHINRNYHALYQEIQTGGGPVFEHGCDIAQIPYPKRAHLFAELTNRPDIYWGGSRPDNIEMITVAFMAHSN